MEQSITLVNGAKVPVGKKIKYEYYDTVDGQKKRIYPALNYNEYVVYDISQVRMRYLVQVHLWEYNFIL